MKAISLKGSRFTVGGMSDVPGRTRGIHFSRILAERKQQACHAIFKMKHFASVGLFGCDQSK